MEVIKSNHFLEIEKGYKEKLKSFIDNQYSDINIVDVSIVIVNWNSGSYLKQTVETLKKHTHNIKYEVIIVDNNSNKEDPGYKFLIENEFDKNFKNILLDQNLGFAKANNLGIDISKGRNILILNPDVVIYENTVKILSDHLDANLSTGMVGPKVLNPDGSFQLPCMRGEPYPSDVFFHLSGLSRLFQNNPNFNKYSLFHLNRNKSQEITILSGCCMMVKKDLIQDIGKMDEQFFLYQEEPDWCWRAKKKNWKIIYNPGTYITHHQGISTKKQLLKSNYIFTQSMIKFFKKYHWDRYNIFQRLFWQSLIWGNFGIKYLRLKVLKG